MMNTAKALSCPVCESSGPFVDLAAREMMFGWREPFQYRECTRCHSLHIAEVPVDLGRFYPEDYYAFGAPRKAQSSVPWLRRAVSAWLVRSPDPLAAALVRAKVDKYPFFSWVRLGGVGPGDAILDVGCGSGSHLERMRRWGFQKLYGVDPYTTNERDEPGLQIRRMELAQVTGSFALIMLHHVLEHVADPAATLTLVRERLQAGGRALVRLPVAGSPLHREYGADWFNLDAPRHLVIPSVEGMGHLARRAGLRLVHTSFDTTDTAYWMSDYYRRNVPMKQAALPEESIRKRLRAVANSANRRGEGDQGIFVLERS